MDLSLIADVFLIVGALAFAIAAKISARRAAEAAQMAVKAAHEAERLISAMNDKREAEFYNKTPEPAPEMGPGWEKIRGRGGVMYGHLAS